MSKYNHADHLLDTYYGVLDHGFVGLKDYYGSDAAIEAAARVSYQSGTRKVSDTRSLIRYLVSHNHSSPVEQASVTFHMRLPLFVIQQILRHRTAKLNQESFRYSEVPDLCQKTDMTCWRKQSTDNKQGSSDYLPYLGHRMADGDIFQNGEALSRDEEYVHIESKKIYDNRIKAGVAREQARKDIPVSTYSSMYWTMDVRNLLHFLTLRCDNHAQEEIRAYANIMAGFVKEIFPITFEAWYDYTYKSTSLSRLDRIFFDYLSTGYMFINGAMTLKNAKFFYERDKDKKHKEIGMTDKELLAFWDKFLAPVEQDFSLPVNKLTEKELYG